MKKRCAFAALPLLMLFCTIAGAESKPPLTIGDVFPDIRTDVSFDDDELAYFGIERGFFSIFSPNKFTIREISSEIILVEFFNASCPSSQEQSAVLNQVYAAVRKSPDLRDRVRFIGIGAGNTEQEVRVFKQRNDISFPLVSDPRFRMYDAAGNPGGTPFMLVLKKSGSDPVVVGARLGPVKEKSYFMATLKNAAEKSIADLNRRVLEKDIAADETRKLRINLAQKKQLELVSKSMLSANGGSAVSGITQKRLASGDGLYEATVDISGKRLKLYSKIISQNPLCDVCHGVHYIITFDSKGYIRDFLPIHVTRLGNNDWNEYDAENMRKQLIGKRLTKELVFDPTIDAVSTATMSSSLIFKGVNELRSAYKELD